VCVSANGAWSCSTKRSTKSIIARATITRAQEPAVKNALQQVMDRIQAIAGASDRLAMRSSELDRIKLDDHLCELVEQIERGIARDGIEVECDVEEVVATADTATSISIIVNELVTNAIKHAFNGEGSGIVRVMGRAGDVFELVVQDDGRGIGPTRKKNGSGLGTRLVENFVKQLGAQHEVVSSENGTTHRLVIPGLG
jgi:two-component sensor histidine kinase